MTVLYEDSRYEFGEHGVLVFGADGPSPVDEALLPLPVRNVLRVWRTRPPRPRVRRF